MPDAVGTGTLLPPGCLKTQVEGFNLRRSAAYVIRRCAGIGGHPSPFGASKLVGVHACKHPGPGACRDVPGRRRSRALRP